MKLMCSPLVKMRRHTKAAFVWRLILVVLVLPLAAKAQLAPMERSTSPDAADILMLVRDWDAKGLILTGWLPSHSVAIQLELLSYKKKLPDFEPNDAVYLKFLHREAETAGEAHVRISPEPRVFEGESWLPVKRDANLVRIGKGLYLVRSIIFNGGVWRQAANPSGAKKSAKSFVRESAPP